jgi:hypothetical protein
VAIAILAIAAFTPVASIAPGQCPGGVCPAPGYVSFGQPALPLLPTAFGQPRYKWLKHEKYADHWVLWLGSRHVGTYRSDQGLYYPWQGTKFGEPIKEAPVAPPVEAGEPVQDFGMGWRPNGTDRWTAGGKEITATAAARDLTDDSGRRFVVGVFPDKAKVESLRKEWQTSPSAAEFRDQYHLQAFESGSPIVTQRGYGEGLYVIGADGKELARTPSYSGLDQLLETLRHLRDGGSLIAPKIEVPTWVWVAGLLLIGFIFGKRSK